MLDEANIKIYSSSLNQLSNRTFVMEENLAPTGTQQTIEASSSSSRGRNQRRKWQGLDDSVALSLMKEVQAHGAHVPSHGDAMVLFGKVAAALNNSGILPWETDAKHVWDRYRLLILQWRRADGDKNRRSGGGEEVTPFDSICFDIASEVDDEKRAREEEKCRNTERQSQLEAAGVSIRQNALNRPLRRQMDSDSNDGGDSASQTPSKKARVNVNDEVQRVILALESAENHRVKIDEQREGRDCQRFEVEKERFEFDKSSFEHRKEMEKRHLQLEKQRLESELARENNAAQERNGMLQVQTEMLALLREIRKK